MKINLAKIRKLLLISSNLSLHYIYTRKLVLSKRGYSKLDILPFPKSHSQEVGFPFDKS